MKKHVLGCLVLIMLAACSDSNTENKEKEGVETILPTQVNEVTVMKLAKGNFNHELVSNGKIVAKEHADLYFRTQEIVAKVYVKNGTFVRKGQKLAELDQFKLNNNLTQSKNALAQATLEMQDVLIGQGYAPDNLDVVPADKLELAKVKSGYEQAKAQYESALYEMTQAMLGVSHTTKEGLDNVSEKISLVFSLISFCKSSAEISGSTKVTVPMPAVCERRVIPSTYSPSLYLGVALIHNSSPPRISVILSGAPPDSRTAS